MLIHQYLAELPGRPSRKQRRITQTMSTPNQVNWSLAAADALLAMQPIFIHIYWYKIIIKRIEWKCIQNIKTGLKLRPDDVCCLRCTLLFLFASSSSSYKIISSHNARPQRRHGGFKWVQTERSTEYSTTQSHSRILCIE